jgi:alpha-L-fucosidase
MAPALLPLLLALSPQASSAVVPPAPVGPLPSPQQLAWHELESYAFVHFNMNTFTDLEWGHGVESPDTFAPTALDCRQWARVCKAAGMKGIILTAKHHDGFCLWPSERTEHSVASSAWRDGGGDVLRELSDACREAGLLFGVYLSPWDRNHPSYGDSPAYNTVFAGQLEEVLTRYGEVFEVWWDGACGEGPNGKRQVYDWPLFTEVVRRTQPDAVIFSDIGPGVRWVGNEAGYAGETCWGMISPEGYERGAGGPPREVLNQGLEDGTHWIPAECDVSIRPGWYYHASQDDQVKSLPHLIDIWHASVGRNANLLLNLPVDRRGLVHENDAARLMELRAWLDATYTVDLAEGARATASRTRGDDPRYGPDGVLDGSSERYWGTDDEVREAWLQLELPEPRLLDRIVLQEPIALGQRVRAFEVQVHVDGAWRQVARGTTIGRKRILAFPGVRSDRVRVRILDARSCPLLSRVALHRAPPEVTIEAEAADFLESTTVRLASSLPGAEIRYTLDGSAPTRASSPYEQPLAIDRTCLLRASAFLGDQASHLPARVELTRWTGESLRAPALAEVPDEHLQGLLVRPYEGGWQSLTDMDSAEPVPGRVHVGGVDLEARPRDEHFALRFEGYLSVPADGIWTLRLTSDDGSRLYLHDGLLIDNDGLHGAVERSTTLGLARGLHPLRLEYFNATGEATLRLEWEGPGRPRAQVAGSDLIALP